MTESYEDIAYDVDARVARITLNRPAKLNAWTAAMERSVGRAVRRAAGDEDVRVIVITGAGRGFCAGADMSRLQDFSQTTPSETEVAAATRQASAAAPAGDAELAAHYAGRFGYMLGVPKPIVAAINGPCAGIGLVLSLFCDLRFATADAKFTTAFAQRGLIAEHGVSWILPRLIGPARAMDLLLSARFFDGREAEQLGLVNRAFAADSFKAELDAYVSRLCQQVSPRSLRVMKSQIWKALFQNFEQASLLADREMQASFGSADFKEGVAHFVEKRAARFEGR